MAQAVKNLPVLQATWVQSLGQKDPLEKGIATHSSILAWRNPWAEEPGELQSMGPQSDTTVTNTFTFHFQGHLCLVSIGYLYSRVWVKFPCVFIYQITLILSRTSWRYITETLGGL